MEPYIPTVLPINTSHMNWEKLSTKVSSASSSLAYYNGILESMINPSIYLSLLETKEAILSSRIEGTITTLDEVLKYEADLIPEDKSKQKDIIEVLNYRRATRHAQSWLKRELPFNRTMICSIQKELMSGVRGKDKNPGEIRKEQVWIGPKHCKIEEATFVPPEPISVNAHLDNFFDFLLLNKIETLIQTAIMHAQFEIIHPFMDGNGRTGRILIPLFLWYKKRLASPMLYISEYLDEHRDDYLGCLSSISQKHDWEQWINFFLDAVDVQAKNNADKAKQVLKLYNQMKDLVATTSNSTYGIKVLDTLFNMLIFRRSDFEKIAGLNHQTTHRIITKLKEEKILVVIQKPSGRSPEILCFKSLYDLINS
jgi:Fic family protein